jgi:receptor protein-tyrosine kinase
MTDMREITIKDILAIIRRHWVWMVLIPLFVGGGVYFYFLQQPNEYTAETRLYVLMEYVDNVGQVRYDTTTSTQFTGDFKELIQTRQVYQETADRLGGTIDMLEDVNIDISAVTGTRLLIVSATSASPALSLNVANTISQVFIEYITRIMKTDAVSIAAEATLPEEPSGPARGRNTALAALLALVGIAGIMIVIEMLNTKIKTIEEAEEVLQTSVLASIPDYRDSIGRYMKYQDPDKTLSDAVSVAVTEGVKTLAANIQFERSGPTIGSIMVTSSMSTEGKSTLTLLLAEALSEDGHNVLVCDFDVKRPSLGRYVGSRNPLDIIDYMTGKATLPQIVTKTRKPYVFFVDFNHQNYSVSQIVKHTGFQKFLAEAKQNFSVVLFDTCPLGMFIDAAMLATLMDGTLVVLGSGMVERSKGAEILGQLKKANANLLGVALNYARTAAGGKYYYGKDRYGGYESGRSKTAKGRSQRQDTLEQDENAE